MKIRINHIETEVSAGMTVMNAASALGIRIPSMCYLKGHSNHPSCMICMVEDETSGKMFPSCAMPVMEGLSILTDTVAVHETRREALELLLSDHLGDCEAPCRLSCPAFMNIPLMNRLIAEGKTAEALRIVREEIAIPLVLGHICPAPCEKACHRKNIDGPVSICKLKKFAAEDPSYLTGLPIPTNQSEKKIAIIGTGPAGMSAAFYLLKYGHQCDLYDRSNHAGGNLRSVPEDLLPKEVLASELEVIMRMGGRFILQNEILPEGLTNLSSDYDAVVLAIGFVPGFLKNELPENVFICGNPEKEERLAVRSAAKGKETAQKMHEFLGYQSEKDSYRKSSISRIGRLNQNDQPVYLKEAELLYQNISSPPSSVPRPIQSEAARCMHCDCRKPHTCKLREYASEYGADRKRFSSSERKELKKEFQHEQVIYEPQKCIRCGLCVDISSSAPDSAGMAFFGRGYHAEIGASISFDMTDSLGSTAEECVKVCPTGALSFKNE